MKKNHLFLGLLVLAALVALVFWGRGRIHFDFGVFRTQIAMADWGKIGIAAGCIYLGYVFRSARWAWLLKPNKKVGLFSLLGTQVIGFTAVALLGRVADPVRPYLVTKKTGLPLSSQLAVYIVERLFDLGSTALLFSSVILFTAWFGQPGALPHPEIVKKAGYWGMALTVAGAVFLVAVRLSGAMVATFLERTFGLVSKKLGAAVGDRVRSFHAGLDTMRTLADFGVVAGLSLAMWLVISMAYLETTRAFVASPQLGEMSFPRIMLLLAFSGGASVFQLPVIGWFTQIGLVAAAMVSFYGAAPEASTACSATLLLVTFLSIIPVGLIWAQFEHVSLRKVTLESEHAGEELAIGKPAE
ncbi:MAG TPA: lysylphosphatidylglycerol synthase transmembrane domain-containing protein [Terracidiphilus sp.]|nr:lysylphosphatidylglycerol synthase transmembrane domain-containing protein [Terracidiphilus sp.]